jgi:kynurenine formamidase
MKAFPYTIIDLTHTLSETTPSWSGGCGFNHEIALDYSDCQDDVKFRVQKLKMHAGIGTHIDAPAHAIPGSTTVDDLKLENLISPCVCIDVSKDIIADSLISPDAVLLFEKEHGKIEPGSFVIIYTGWDKFWNEPDQYRNDHQFPSISEEIAVLLLERGITGLGIDTLSPDTSSSGFPVHKHLLGAGKYIIENIANAAQLPPNNSFTLAMPIKAKDLTEAPIRLIALLN